MRETVNHWALYIVFLLSYFIRTFVTCMALEKIIVAFGVDQLPLHFGTACAVTLLVSWLLIVGGRTGPRVSFYLVHGLLLACGLAIALIDDPVAESRLIFYGAMGLGLLVYVTNWYLASFAVSPFEAPRVFSRLGKLTLAGILLGAIAAMMSAQFDFETILAPLWIGTESVLLVLTYIATRTPATGLEPHQLHILGDLSETLRTAKNRYLFLRTLCLWLLAWGFLYTLIQVQVAQQFAERTSNIAALYGALALATTALITFVNVSLYPALVRWYRLGGMFVLCAATACGLALAYLGFPIFALAVVTYVMFEVLNNSVKAPAVGAQLNLYPGRYRHHFRLLIEVAAPTLGGILVLGMYYAPTWIMVCCMVTSGICLVWLGRRTRIAFNEEVMNLLLSDDEVERSNAIDLYDHLEHQDDYERFLEQLTSGEELSTNINILRTFATLKTHKPLPEILDMLSPEMDNSLRIAVLRYIDELDFDSFDPFLHYRALEVLKDICLHGSPNVARAMAIKTFVQRASPETSVSFVIDELNSDDDRVIANAIDGLSYLHCPGVVYLLEPYLKHETARIRANAVVALWQYPESRFRVRASITSMLYSESLKHRISAIYAAGKVKDNNYVSFIKDQLPAEDLGLQRVILIALLNLGEVQYVPQVVDLILGENEPQGVNTCYLSISLEQNILNEGIISTIYHRGQIARELAISRYSSSGAFCREQIQLLRGMSISTHRVL